MELRLEAQAAFHADGTPRATAIFLGFAAGAGSETRHRAAEKPLRAWYHEAKVVRWKNFAEIKRHYPSADVLPGNRVVFDIKGNHFRLIVKIHYNTGVVFIRFAGTHKEYDAVDANTI